MFSLVPSVRVISELRIEYGYPIAFRYLIRGYADEQLESQAALLSHKHTWDGWLI